MKKLLVLLTLVPTLCFAGGRAQLQWDGSYRFTDDSGMTTGYAQPQWNGDIRFTDSFGVTPGRAQRGWNGDYRFEPEQPQYLPR
jgi:hypothetical protein